MKSYISRKLKFAVNLVIYLVSYRVILNGKVIKIPRIYKIDLGDFLSEKWMNEIIRKILGVKKGAFVDVGFNLGQTLVKVKTTDLNREYYGFEPNPVCYYYTNELIKVNKYPNSNLLAIGLSNKTEIKNLFAQNHSDSASIISEFKENKPYSINQFVPVFEGDLLVNYFGLNSLSIIKVDVEGAESDVLDGLRNSLLKFRPYVLCEVLPVYNEDSVIGRLRKQRQEKLLAILKDLKYQIFRIMHDGRIVCLDTIGIHSDMSLRDYLFAPKEEIETLKRCFALKN